MAKMAVILRGLAASNKGDAYGPYFTSSTRGLILINKFRIYNRGHNWWRKPCQFGRLDEKTPHTVVPRPGFEPPTSRAVWPPVRKTHALGFSMLYTEPINTYSQQRLCDFSEWHQCLRWYRHHHAGLYRIHNICEYRIHMP